MTANHTSSCLVDNKKVVIPLLFSNAFCLALSGMYCAYLMPFSHDETAIIRSILQKRKLRLGEMNYFTTATS